MGTVDEGHLSHGEHGRGGLHRGQRSEESVRLMVATSAPDDQDRAAMPA